MRSSAFMGNSGLNEGLRFERAYSKDAEGFLALEKSLIGPKTYSGVSSLEEALEEIATNEVYLIYEGSELAGSVQMERKSPEHTYISGLVVTPKFQGQGIGRAAAEFIIKQAGDVERIDLVVHPENSRAVGLYKSLGFKVESEIENYYGDGEPRLVMALQKS